MRKIIEKFNNLDIISKASIVYIFVGFFQKGISLISGPIFTRLLSQVDYGIFSAYNSWYELLGVVAMLSLSAGVYNNGLLEFEKDRNVFTYSLLILSNLATLIVVFWGIIGSTLTKGLLDLPKALLVIMTLSFLFSPALTFWTTRQRYEYKYKKPCLITIVSTILAVGISILVTYFSDDTSRLCNKIWSEKGVLLIFWIVAYIYLGYKAKFKIRIQYWKYALAFNLPLIPHYLSNYILNSMDRIMIINMVGATEAAIYSVAYSASFLIQIFWQSINGAILPLTYESIKNNEEFKIQKKVIPFLAIYGFLCVLVAMIAPELMSFLAPSSYNEGVYLVPVLVMGAYLTGLYCIFANVEFYYKSTKMIALNSVISASLNIVLNYFFIIKFGYIAAAYTTVICYFIQTLFHYFNYRRVGKKIYNDKIIIKITSVVAIGCFLCLLLYKIVLVRYSVLMIIVVTVIAIRHKLIDFLKISR